MNIDEAGFIDGAILDVNPCLYSFQHPYWICKQLSYTTLFLPRQVGALSSAAVVILLAQGQEGAAVASRESKEAGLRAAPHCSRRSCVGAVRAAKVEGPGAAAGKVP
jgi:hypothetical protein